jgi:hypothetical protein
LTSALALAGCDVAGPGELPIARVTVPRCITEQADLFVYRNEGEDSWVAPPRNLPDSTFTIDATPRVILAWSGIRRWTILRVSVEELERVDCLTPTATHSYTGAVSNLRTDEQVQVAVGSWSTSMNGNSQPATFTATPQAHPFDAFAYGRSSSGLRIIGRRAQAPTAGSTLPTFDFASSEARPLGLTGATFNPIGVGHSGTIYAAFQSSLGSRIDLETQTMGQLWTGTAFPRLPGALEALGDLYVVTLDVRGSFDPSTSDYSRRATAHFSPASTNRGIALGPIPVKPTVGTVALPGRKTITIAAPVQQEYDGHADATIEWSESGLGFLFLAYTTRGYRGTATIWDLSVPPGIPNVVYPTSPAPVTCSYNARSYLWERLYGSGAVRHAGEIHFTGTPTCLVP